MMRATGPAARPRGPLLATALASLLAMLVAGCTTPKPPAAPPAGEQPAPAAGTTSRPVPTVRLVTPQTPQVRAYRKLAARHLYEAYPKKIYKGKIPPLVYAVVVSETDVDASGKVTGVHFARTPSHAPEVSGQIARLIEDASPMPSPGRVGAHTYMETWLWDKSGRFQLDTLTEGQRSR